MSPTSQLQSRGPQAPRGGPEIIHRGLWVSRVGTVNNPSNTPVNPFIAPATVARPTTNNANTISAVAGSNTNSTLMPDVGTVGAPVTISNTKVVLSTTVATTVTVAPTRVTDTCSNGVTGATMAAKVVVSPPDAAMGITTTSIPEQVSAPTRVKDKCSTGATEAKLAAKVVVSTSNAAEEAAVTSTLEQVSSQVGAPAEQPSQPSAIWLERVLLNLKQVQASEVVQEILNNCPERQLLGDFFFGVRGVVFQGVNELVERIRSSDHPQEVSFVTLLKDVHKDLRPLIKETVGAMSRGLEASAKARKRSDKVENWAHHGISAITRPIGDLNKASRKHASPEDVTIIDSKLQELHKLIAESVIRKRQNDPQLHPRDCVLNCLRPVLMKVERVIKGQLNASRLLQVFLTHVEARLLLDMLGKKKRKRKGSRAKQKKQTVENREGNDEPVATSTITEGMDPNKQAISVIVETLATKVLPKLIEEALKKALPKGPRTVENPPRPEKSAGNQPAGCPPNNSEDGALRGRNIKPSYASVVRGNGSKLASNPMQSHRQRATEGRPISSRPNGYLQQHSESWRRDPNLFCDQDGWRTVSYRKPRPERYGGSRSGTSFTGHVSSTRFYHGQQARGAPAQR